MYYLYLHVNVSCLKDVYTFLLENRLNIKNTDYKKGCNFTLN